MVFSLSFARFYAHIPQILSRLFPFQRGLTHDFWAPNFWAFYCFLNRSLETLFRKFNRNFTYSKIEECQLSVLPEIAPFITIALIIGVSSFIWRKMLFGRKKVNFIEFCGLQALVFFIFGFHVHEKAILIPLTLFQLS